MNIARKLIAEIEGKIDELKQWVEKHEKMFDHSIFKIHDKRKINEWIAYHNKVMKD